jgi:hypothetical protein
MMPNFEPEIILPRLGSLIRPADRLLLSANLVPGTDYAEGMRRILPLYDNEPTRDWLLSFLLELGVGSSSGKLEFSIEAGQKSLKRVVARFHFAADCEIGVGSERICFLSGDSLRLFFSYRHTPALVENLLAENGMEVLERWTARSGEEGVFLAGRTDRLRHTAVLAGGPRP